MTNSKETTILCFGEVLWDKLPSGAQPGGAPLNVSIHIKRQGLDPVLISRTGKDTDGRKLVNFLDSSGIETQFIQCDKQLPTSEVLVHLDKNKNASYEICEPVAWDNILPGEEILEQAGKADLIIYGSLASRNLTTRTTLFKLLDSSTATRVLDVNLRAPYDKAEIIRELLHKSDFIKLNDDELKEIYLWDNPAVVSEKEMIIWCTEKYHCTTFCVTRGSKGAILYYDKTFHEHGGFKVTAQDTVGAGDSFLASLLASLSQNTSPQKALELACATGAYVASQKGAVPEYTLNHILQIINTQNV